MEDKKTILLVDDSTTDIQMLVQILKDDYSVLIARNGEKALEILETLVPDLILLDVNMPGLNGYQVLDKIKNRRDRDKYSVIFLTVNASEEDEEKGLKLGAVDYIKKPIRPAIIKARINTHIQLQLQKEKLIFDSTHDTLTGLYSQNHFILEGNRKFSRATRQNDRLSFMVMNLDRFKDINNKNGHLVGDLVLQEVATLLSDVKCKRNEDYCARFAGDEFIIILESCSGEDAKNKAKSIREMISELNPCGLSITASFGICELSKAHKNFEGLLRDAFEALYMAKGSGENKVFLFTDEEL